MLARLTTAGAPFSRSRALTGPAPVLVLVAVAGAWGVLRGGFTDLFVYRFGGRAVLDAGALYAADDPVTGLPFTYPPFAALLFVPLAPWPDRVTDGLWTALSVAALALVVHLVRRELGRPSPGWLVALLTAGALALEPVWQNLTFGQVNLVLMAVILVDLLRPERRWSGVLLGLAAAVKLTPLVFVVLLLLVGRRAAAGRAVGAFVAALLLGFVLRPGSSTAYWTDGLLEADRVGPPALAHNQSVYGALTRLGDGPPPDLLWLLLAGPLAVGVLLLGAAWWRRGDRVLGSCLAAVAMLLASPVAWSHHWVWAVPVALLLWERSRVWAVAWTAVFVARPVVWPPYGRGRELDWTPAEHLAGHSYLIAALAFAGWAAWQLRQGSGEVLAEREVGQEPEDHRDREAPATDPRQPVVPEEQRHRDGVRRDQGQRVEQVADPVGDE